MIRKILKFIRDKIIFYKIYMMRTTSYINLITSGMILFLFLDTLKEKGFIDIELDTYFIPICILGFALFTFIGWLEIKYLKGRQIESVAIFDLSPRFLGMEKDIRDIKEVIKKESGNIK